MPKQLSIRDIFIIMTCFAIGFLFIPRKDHAPPSPEWMDFMPVNHRPLKNTPVVLTNATLNKIRAKITNTGETTLQYISESPTTISRYVESELDGKWHVSNWSWCPHGQQRFDIRPNETVAITVNFINEDHRERVLALFFEKNTDRCGMVVVATEMH